MSKVYIYEVVDATDEDMFFLRSVHLDPNKAIKEARNSGENGNLEFQDDYGLIEVRRYTVDSGENYLCIFSSVWDREPGEKWKEVSTKEEGLVS